MQNTLKSILKKMRSEAILALFCNGDPRAINVINFMDSMINPDGTINNEAILVASEVLREK